MYTIYGDVMFEYMENLKLIDILRRPASRYREFNSRPSHGFVFKISGKSIYNFSGREITHKEGELLFIPKGEVYSLHCISDKSEYLLINFDADIKCAEVKIFNIDNYFEKDFLYENLERLWLFGGVSEKYKCLSAFYDIISFITHKQNNVSASRKNILKIAAAVEYLEGHIFDVNLKAGDLCSICNMSDTYFRSIFRESYGMNPAQYINNKRLSRARAIIATGDYETISDVARSVGYDDALYFSKIFKRKYKLPPSKYVGVD